LPGLVFTPMLAQMRLKCGVANECTTGRAAHGSVPLGHVLIHRALFDLGAANGATHNPLGNVICANAAMDQLPVLNGHGNQSPKQFARGFNAAYQPGLRIRTWFAHYSQALVHSRNKGDASDDRAGNCLKLRGSVPQNLERGRVIGVRIEAGMFWPGPSQVVNPD
jgi:hypothetical protein